MRETQQSQSADSGNTGADAAAALAEIQRRQEHVIKSALVPVWCWWVIAAGMVGIGVARDTHDAVVLAVGIPLAALVMAAPIVATLPEVRRRVRVSDAAQPGGPGAAALFGLIVLVITVIVAAAAGLTAGHVPHPLTIAYGAGAAVLVIGGPLLNRYLGWLMLSRARQPLTDTQEPGSRPWRGLLDSEPGDRSPDHAGSTTDGGTS